MARDREERDGRERQRGGGTGWERETSERETGEVSNIMGWVPFPLSRIPAWFCH